MIIDNKLGLSYHNLNDEFSKPTINEYPTGLL